MMRAILATSAVLAAGPAAAQSQPWSVDLGAVGRTRPTHLGSTHYTQDVVPVMEATWGDSLSFSFDDGAKWIAGKLGPVEFGPIAQYRQSFNDGLPRGAFRMADTIEVGGFSQVKTPLGIAEARLRHAVNGYDGWSGDLAFDTGAPVTQKLMLGGELRLSWADSSFTQEYFGLHPVAAKHFGLPRFLDEDYLTGGVEFDAAREISPRARLVMALTADRILGDIAPGPLFKTREIYTLSLGATYHWSNKDRRTAP